MIFYVLYNFNQNEKQIEDIILQNENYPYNKQSANTPFFTTYPEKPDINSIPLNKQLSKVFLIKGKLIVIEKLLIDIESEIVKDRPPCTDMILYEKD